MAESFVGEWHQQVLGDLHEEKLLTLSMLYLALLMLDVRTNPATEHVRNVNMLNMHRLLVRLSVVFGVSAAVENLQFVR